MLFFLAMFLFSIGIVCILIASEKATSSDPKVLVIVFLLIASFLCCVGAFSAITYEHFPKETCNCHCCSEKLPNYSEPVEIVHVQWR